ncbi:cytochrome P450 4c21-like isoform X2 [Chrysoperla carnea]|uniref:cytochrome P450 4c21-like isoform X2 n=1 Tax=Chrysoperla carnea TaxID=189513 RepID=UPI001D08C3CA|nr:cytochrome P450 4c21-like isoform X2 [Chrysoperla carnea]
MFLTLLLTCLVNKIIAVVLLVTVIVVSVRIYLWNYLRMCYYASKLPGPPAYPIIGNGELLFGSHEEVSHNLLDMCLQYQKSLIRLWLGPIPLVLTLDPRAIQEVLNNPNALEKSFVHKIVWNTTMGKSIFTSEVPEWKHHRGIIVKGFSPIILKSYFKIFVEKINILSENLDFELNKETSFDIFKYLSRTTVDSVCGSTMGVNINSHKHSESYFDATHRLLYFVVVRLFNVFKIPTLFYRFTEDYKIASKCSKIVREFTEKIIAEKRNKYEKIDNNLIDVKANKKNEYKKPLLEFLMDFTKNNEQFTDAQLRDEVNFIIFAAYETSANALSYVLLNLAAHKDIQTKVYNEILDVLGENNGDSIKFDDLPKLKYMEMVIKESMRRYSTVPFMGRQATQDIKIGDYTIAKGVIITIPIIAVHLNKNYWENPLKFDPERFTPENIKNRHPYAYIPFSAGPRNCIGIRYAWIVMKITLATLLSRYEFHTDLNLDELRFQFNVSLTLVNGHQKVPN